MNINYSKRNKVLDMVAGIDHGILKDCGDLSLIDDMDRAKLAWWIYNNFCIGDYRENLHIREIDLISNGRGGPFIDKESGMTVAAAIASAGGMPVPEKGKANKR